MCVNNCSSCDSDWILPQSKIIDGAVFYFFECQYCGKQSEYTLQDSLASYLWDIEQGPEGDTDISLFEEEIERSQNKISEYENMIIDEEDAISLARREIEKSMELIEERRRYKPYEFFVTEYHLK